MGQRSTGRWYPVAILHNLTIRQAIDFDHASIAPPHDERVVVATDEYPALRHLLENFEDQFQCPIPPSVVLFDQTEIAGSFDAIVAFRNVLAISAIVAAWSSRIGTGNADEHLLWSDYFEIYPFFIAGGEGRLVARTPASWVVNSAARFRGQSSPQLVVGRESVGFADESLLGELVPLWYRAFGPRRRDARRGRSVFRSLEMAFRAAAVPYGNQGSLHDHGMSCVLWVSAFEILLHKGGTKRIRCDDVLDAICDIEFLNAALNRRSYRAKWNRKVRAVTLAQKIYTEMYQTRNRFVHGNPVAVRHLFPRGDRRCPSLISLAPLLYKPVILTKLGGYRRPVEFVDQAREGMARREERALSVARRPLRAVDDGW